ncbi:hypothetical protein [Frankia sp. R82]|uniref:hypothetical protein n=1 Tax=Frankia sp. R82 TaxID=2950553 RepID=UPI002043D699|nr:hypothetical protein [Frankia sp. R82]MCM3882840.1 hypothetical protein [Frankia sp. R82]
MLVAVPVAVAVLMLVAVAVASHNGEAAGSAGSCGALFGISGRFSRTTLHIVPDRPRQIGIGLRHVGIDPRCAGLASGGVADLSLHAPGR